MSWKEQFLKVEFKTRSRIFFDNFLGGMAWGFGTVIGATIVVGILGLAIVNTRKVPLLGDLVKVIADQIQTGISEIQQKNTNSTNNNSTK